MRLAQSSAWGSLQSGLRLLWVCRSCLWGCGSLRRRQSEDAKTQLAKFASLTSLGFLFVSPARQAASNLTEAPLLGCSSSLSISPAPGRVPLPIECLKRARDFRRLP